MVADYVHETEVEVPHSSEKSTDQASSDETEPPRNIAGTQTSLFPDQSDLSEMSDSSEETVLSEKNNLSDNHETPPADLVRQGTSFISNLVQTLSDPEQAKQLVDTLVHNDPATGQTSIRIPVSNRQTVQNLFTLIGQLLKQ